MVISSLPARDQPTGRFRPEAWSPDMIAMLVLIYAYAEADTAPSVQLRESAWDELHELDRLRWQFAEGSPERLLVARLFGVVEVHGGLLLEALREREALIAAAIQDYERRFVHLSKTQALSTALRSTLKLCLVGGIGILLTKLGLNILADDDQQTKAVTLPYVVGLAGGSLVWFATEIWKSLRTTRFTLKRDKAIHQARTSYQRKRLSCVQAATKAARDALTAHDPDIALPPYQHTTVLLHALLDEDEKAAPSDPFATVARRKIGQMTRRFRREKVPES